MRRLYASVSGGLVKTERTEDASQEVLVATSLNRRDGIVQKIHWRAQAVVDPGPAVLKSEEE